MKVIKDNINGSNMFVLEGENAVMASGPNAVSVNRTSGVFINGPLAVSSPVDSMKFSGIFRINPIAASGLPSTMITPIPTFTIETPIRGIANMTAAASILVGL